MDKIGFVPAATVIVLSNHYSFPDGFPENGTNYYRLKIVDVDGKFVYSEIISIELKPEKDIIYECFPNPFSSVTNIKFEIAEKSLVQINLYNDLGIKIVTLMKEKKDAGVYSVQWNAKNMAPAAIITR